MKQFKTIEKPVEELEALTCNKCGVTAIVRGDGLDSLSALHQFQSFEPSGMTFGSTATTFKPGFLRKFKPVFVTPEHPLQ